MATAYKGYEIRFPTSGGKAGKGHNKTTSIQIRRNGFIVKQFKVKLPIDKGAVMETAKEHIDRMPQ